MKRGADRWRALPRRVLMAPIRAYRLLLSPWLGTACRFSPTCSAYALQALADHGARRGGALMLYRLARCHPWCAGGIDPVPDPLSARAAASHRRPRLFSDLLTPAPADVTAQRKTSV